MPAFPLLLGTPRLYRGGGGQQRLRVCLCERVNAMALAGCCIYVSLSGCAPFGPETRTRHGSPLEFLLDGCRAPPLGLGTRSVVGAVSHLGHRCGPLRTGTPPHSGAPRSSGVGVVARCSWCTFPAARVWEPVGLGRLWGVCIYRSGPVLSTQR